MIFSIVLAEFKKEEFLELSYYLIAALFLLIFSRLLSFLFAFQLSPKIHTPTFHLGNTFHNYGFMAYGLTESLFGISIMPKLFAFVLVFELFLWTYGISMFNNKKKGKFSFKNIMSPPAIAMITAITLVFFHPIQLNNFMIGKIVLYSGKIAVPLALFFVGIIIFNALKKINYTMLKSSWFRRSILLRHMTVPLLFIPISHLLTEDDLRHVCAVQAIMPLALMTAAVAAIYGGNHKKLGPLITCSQLLCVLTIPLWIILYQGIGIIKL